MIKIMVADSDPEASVQIKKILGEKNYGISTYENGKALLEEFSKVKPDLVILEFEMPGLSGIETCYELRKRSESYNIPIVIVSAKDHEDDIIKGLAGGADEYILKPLRKSELVSKVSFLLSKRTSALGSEMAGNVIFANHYMIQKTLGKGGYSTVYLAEDVRSGKKAALKILDSKKVEKKYISQFLREAYGLSLLEHRNIVKLVEFGNYANNYFIVTEFIEGESLRSLVKQTPVSENYALFLASEVCEAMKYMNKHSIVHRDIKPDNILISPDNRVVLVDFGLAKDQHQHTLSFEGEMQGTPQILSPEYIKGDSRLTIKVDIYSLGITLFYAVSGKFPFSGDPRSIVNDHLYKLPPPLIRKVPLISRKFSEMVEMMLIKDPRKRCSLKELSQMIENCRNQGKIKGNATSGISKSKKEIEKTMNPSFDYHKKPFPGKIGIIATKPCETQQDLSLAYTPGVADPCLAIKKDPEKVWDYTSRGNMVAVVSDGTAVLGLGNIGPEAGLPVMEGKAVLFKRFADIDAIPLCLNRVFNKDGRTDPDLLIETVQRLEPTFGGINLEDIAAPACFRVEKELKASLSIPVFHDDQHGTAIISLAGLLNALKITGRKIENCRFVINGAGAAGISCSEFYITAGAKRENFIMCDSAGVIYKGRKDGMNPEKERFAVKTKCRTLEDALEGADIFLGFSIGNIVTEKMVKKMAKNSIVFAMANPTPEIFPDKALAAGAAVVGTGRTDFPNQINNVLGFPGIFRGALDVRAGDINEKMKLAASKALSEIVSESIPDSVYEVLSNAYPKDARNGLFDGKNPMKNTFIIPKPFDPRVVPRVARYVAEAAMKSGTAKIKIRNLNDYETTLSERIKF